MPGDDFVNSVPSGVKLTYDDLLLFPEDDGLRHELIDGEHYVTTSPNIKHQAISMNLSVLIGGWLELHPIGRVFHAPTDVVISRFDVVVPDLVFVSSSRLDAIGPLHLTAAPDLVVEIGSPSTRKRDETIKWRLYERSGVSEYWLVDPKTDVVRVYRRDGEAFGQPSRLSREAGDVLTSPLLPGLDLPLARIFKGV